MNRNDKEALVRYAIDARESARPHISKYRVGAAILSKAGEVFRGANIEFDNFSNTIHAEETAIANMVMGGFSAAVAIAVATTGTPDDPFAFPCGMCRQSLFEFGGPGLIVIAANVDGRWEETTMGLLLPRGFRLERRQE